MSFDPRDYDYDLPDAPPWLAQFVRDEARPLLVRHQQAAREALARWLACHDEQVRQREAWRARRQELLEQESPPNVWLRRKEFQQLADDGNPHEPSDLELLEYERRAQADTRNVLIVGKVQHNRRCLVSCWGPSELHAENEPHLDFPLPLPRDRDMPPDECWVALLAVHDVARDRREWLGPADSIPSYAVLCSRARELTEKQLPDLRTVLRMANASLPRNQGETGQGEEKAAGASEVHGPETPAEKFKKLTPASRKAYLAFEWAQSKAGKKLEDKEAYDLLKEGIPEADAGELTDYELPSFETWTKHLRNARALLQEQKYTPRRARPRGKSVVRADQIEPKNADE